MKPRVVSEEVPTVLHPHAPGAGGDASFVLVVEAGADQGRTFTIDGSQPSRVLVGQSSVCEVLLADREVSRRHAALEISLGRLRISDLGSSNGTFVNDVSVRDAFLRGGETVRLGSTRLRVQRKTLDQPVVLTAEDGFGRLLGASPEMRRLYPLCDRLAKAKVPVIIEGETGTGKEILAECLHEQGPRAQGPFIVFDCTAIPANLVESELLGHERGAFTGAVASRKGVFEQAHGGTLLIDEIGDLEPSLQPKLLRAIERSEVRHVGGDKVIQVDVRVLCATRRDLDHEVQAGRFRDDLFHRLAVARIELPPLRERRGDISLLVRRFWKEMGGEERALGAELLARWEDQPWPGNVRELRNAVARQLALGELATSPGGPALRGEPPRAGTDVLEAVLAERLPLIQARQRVVEAFERRYIERVLAEHGGNVMRAAAASGIARRYFQLLRAKREK
ncbi:MAG TPA: sigma 54-interacting transcriptional regulator [Myxococcaceae bacterium]|nr:sigma 54-interacting transcriptional regulator [Myxococcaceae bacterium]